jgi:hypothetical protein
MSPPMVCVYALSSTYFFQTFSYGNVLSPKVANRATRVRLSCLVSCCLAGEEIMQDSKTIIGGQAVVDTRKSPPYITVMAATS